jgi:colanic acid/amylovoran biosynthesis glycosyltransferase
MTAPLCIVVKGFPRLSETFITRELEALQSEGVRFSIAALRRPTRDASKVVHGVETAPNYLPEYLHEEPVRVIRAYAAVKRLAGFASAWRLFRADFARDMTRSRLRRFGQACVLAAELPSQTRHLHAHFIHTPASVARYAATMRCLSFSVSAHAKDIWTTPDWDLREKLSDVRFACVCNQVGAQRLSALAPPGRIHTWPHLVQAIGQIARPPRSADLPIRLLTVARAVPKKGLRTLMQALAFLPEEPRWSWTYIGGGPLLKLLQNDAMLHPYKERISLIGAQSHGAVMEALASHDMFVLAAEETDDRDRDGRPNALIEAMSAGLACVASPTGGIPELLSGGAGVMPEPRPQEFAKSLADVMAKPRMIEQLGTAARQRAQALEAEGTNSFLALARALRMASGQ